jgi:hypothetical protein
MEVFGLGDAGGEISPGMPDTRPRWLAHSGYFPAAEVRLDQPDPALGGDEPTEGLDRRGLRRGFQPPSPSSRPE